MASRCAPLLLLLWVAGGGDACGGAGGCVGNTCFPYDDDSWTTGGGCRVTVSGFFFQRFSGSGGDAISGEGRWRLLLLLVFSDGDVVDDVFLRAQDERLGLPFPQIISGVGVLAGDGFVGSFCFVSAKECELPVIPQGGMWIPAVGVRSGGGGCSWRLLGDEDAKGLSVVYIRLHGGSLSLAALPLLVFLVGVCWARRQAVSGSCGASSGRTEESLEERSFTFKSFGHFVVIFYSFRISIVLGDVLSLK